MAKSTIVVMVAVDKKETSAPFRVYLREGYEMPSKNVVLRLDNGVNRDGNEVVTISNSNVGLIASHGVDYVNETLTGFRAKIEEDIYITAKVFVDKTVAESAVNKAEKF